MQSLYGIELPQPSVSTPPHKRDINTLEGGVNTDNKESEMVNDPSSNRLEKLQPAQHLLVVYIYLIWELQFRTQVGISILSNFTTAVILAG